MKMASFSPPAIVFISKWLFFSGERVGVVVNKDYCFDINEIQLSKKIHEAKKIQTRISNERKWFERTRICRIPSNLSRRLPGLNFKACH